MEEQKTDSIDYGAKAEKRHDNFIARAFAAVSGAVAGVTSFKIFQKKALREYLDRRFNNRDWINGALDDAGRPVDGADITARVREIHQNVVDKKAETLSGAPTTQASLSTLRDQLEMGDIRVLPGTTVGDMAVNSAYRDLLTRNKPFVEKLVENFGKEADRIRDKYKSLLAGIEAKHFTDQSSAVKDEIWADVARINKAYQHSSDMEARLSSIRKLGVEKKHLFKNSAEKFFEEVGRAHANFIDYTHEAKKKCIEIPIIDEMMKSGQEPGRMGLRLRQVHKNERVIALATVTAVAVGAVAYKAMRSYLQRNDKDDTDSLSFQDALSKQRENDANKMQQPAARTA